MAVTTTSDAEFIIAAIDAAFKKRVECVAGEEIAACLERIRERVAEQVDAIALSALVEYSAARHGTDLVITVRKKL